MVLMEGFDAYKMYIALKLHFTTKSYNFLDYKGKTRAKRSTFENRNDRYFFKKLSNRKDMQQFLVANFLTGNKWIGNLVNEEEAEKEYFKWKKRIESLSYTFTNDLDKLDDVLENNILVKDGHHPILLRKYMKKEICPETVLIFRDIVKEIKFDFFNYWDRKIEEKILWPMEKQKLLKYRPFFSIDLPKYKRILVDFYKQV